MKKIDRIIERWENVQRVLKALTPHERRHHFEMQSWGHKTDCGTVACVAGHCSLDPWFRRRGFAAEWDKGYDVEDLVPTRGRSWSEMVDDFFDPPNFEYAFGGTLSDILSESTGIFYGGRGDSVGQVLKAIDVLLRKLRKLRDEESPRTI